MAKASCALFTTLIMKLRSGGSALCNGIRQGSKGALGGGPRIGSRLLVLAVVLPVASAQTPLLIREHGSINPPSSSLPDRFGWSIDSEGDLLVIGDPIWVSAGSPVGNISIYRSVAGGWSLEQMIEAPDGQLSSPTQPNFGSKVVVHGQDIIVTARGQQDPSAPGLGAVYTYRRLNGQWTMVQELRSPADGVAFASDIAANAGTLIIGSYRRGPNTSQYVGGVYLFVQVAGQWVLHQDLAISNLLQHSEFGASGLSIDGDVLVVGDRGYDALSTGQQPGGVTVFERESGIWTESVTFGSPVPISHSGFGTRVALRGTEFVVGQPYQSTINRAFVYRKTGPPAINGGWELVQGLTSPLSNPETDSFGSAIALSGDRLLIGSSTYSNGTQNSFGAALLYTKDAAGDWQADFHLRQSCPTSSINQVWGFDVELMDDWAMVSAIRNPGITTVAGRVGIYPYPIEKSLLCQGPLNSNGKRASLRAGGSKAVADNHFFIGAKSLPMDSFSLLMASKVSTYLPGQGGANGALCLDPASLGRVGVYQGLCDQWSLRVDLAAIPTNPATAVQPGETWFFQLWHRDLQSTGPTSSFSQAIEVTFE